jgi:hypothetical protein
MEKGTSTDLQEQLTEQKPNNGKYYYDQVYDRKVELITAGLHPYLAKCLRDEKQLLQRDILEVSPKNIE